MKKLLEEVLTEKLWEEYNNINTKILNAIGRILKVKKDIEELRQFLEKIFGKGKIEKWVSLERVLKNLNELLLEFNDFHKQFKMLLSRPYSKTEEFLKGSIDKISADRIPTKDFIEAYDELCDLCEQKGIATKKLNDVKKLYQDFRDLINEIATLNYKLQDFLKHFLERQK